jgi:hypothetical protein
MPTSFQYRLQQYESAPPDESWQVISLRLSEELQPGEIIIAKKLTDFLQPPPPGLWSAISSGLQETETTSDLPALTVHSGWPSAEPAFIEYPSLASPAGRLNDSQHNSEEPAPKEFEKRDSGEQKPRLPARVLYPFNWRRLAIAAAVVGIAISALYYFAAKSDTARQLSASTNPAKNNGGKPKLPATVIDGDEPLVIAPTTSMGMAGSKLFRKPVKRLTIVQPESDLESSYEAEAPNTEMTYANINAADRVVADESIAIPNEPIRDNHGNIIMDEKLVSAPDVNYVTVTGPNGEQTKISKKFLHALSYMNAGTDDDHLGIALQESSMWKWLFKEWREKLLKQPTFIPSTTNFLDIMELKEILHENF